MSQNDLISTGTARARSSLNSFSMEHTTGCADGISSTTCNQSFIGGSLSSSYFRHSSGPSAFHPVVPLLFPYKWPLFDRHCGNESLSILQDQKSNSYLTDFSESKSTFVFKSKPVVGRTEASTALKTVQSEIEVTDICEIQNDSREKRKKSSSTNSDCCSSESPNSGNKDTNLLPSKKKPKGEMSAKVKDERYWQRRHRNNIAAKKSRDAKRRQELCTQQRVTFLKTENTRLLLELSCLRQENTKLKNLLGV